MLQWFKKRKGIKRANSDISKYRNLSVWGAIPSAVTTFKADLDDLQLEIKACDDLEALAQNEMPELYSVTEDGTAIIPIHGTILPSVPWFYALFGVQATGMDQSTEALLTALEDPQINAIELDIDSPGGSVDGVAAFGELVAASKTIKPITAHASGMAASAAYWIGSQASHFTAQRGSEIGSIGVYAVYEDSSEAAKREGVEVVVISSGGIKGAGVSGAPITQEQRKGLQEEIDAYTNLFVASVAAGRNLQIDQIKQLATGKVWLADEAKSLGLIDAVISPLDQMSNKENEEMDKKLEERLVALEAALAKAQAEKEAAERKVIEGEDKAKAELIQKAIDAGKVTPQLLDAVRKLATVGTLNEVQQFLAVLSVQTRGKQMGNGAGDNKEKSGNIIEHNDQATAKALRLSDREFVMGAEIESVSCDGIASLKDGSRKPLKDVFGE